MTAEANDSLRANEPNLAFQKLVRLFAAVPTDDRTKLMTMAITNAPPIDSDTQRRIIAVRNELAMFLSLDGLAPSVTAHLEDTRTEKEVAFALDHIISEFSDVTASETTGDTQ